MNNLKKNKQGYGYKYTDLSAIHDYLESIGERYIQYIKRIDNDDYIMTRKYKGDQLIEELQGCRVVQATLSGKSNPAQEQGSALTYARRYSLLLAYGLATEDDDGESLSTPKKIGNREIDILKKTIIKYNITEEELENILSKYGYINLEDIEMDNYAKIGNEMSR